MHSREPLAHAVDYNLRVVAQAQDLIAWFGRDPEMFRGQVGPHLRHVLEHYEEFLAGVQAGIVDYDARRRDRGVERDPDYAEARFAGLCERLRRIEEPGALPSTIAVSQQGGLEGDERFISRSTPLRELMFLASHATHHFAVLKPVLERAGASLPPTFGKAPGTIRHERGAAR